MNEDLKLPLEFTQAAACKLKMLLAEESNPNLKLRVYINGGGCSGFEYGFILDDQINAEDLILDKDGVMLVVDPISMQYLVNGSIDYIENLQGSRFIVNNPNAKIICGCGLSFSI
ncbi:iron-sulfur cluster insertion protein ErpA [Candidatus Profftia sp. (ex Adelges kitamiensis)]|uniref:iron-sulfur cluster insertion protein ErpA n=1 Tax=Candidatus Profftia sp. (ex Adelges kitamiensis) TaxID=2864218 RepID=UPI001CE38EC8|nr:iron-sulfur cluster insertion protein ErpA [Candidatus Profftia sp. (ex Adelges kitamiensis)]